MPPTPLCSQKSWWPRGPACVCLTTDEDLDECGFGTVVSLRIIAAIEENIKEGDPVIAMSDKKDEIPAFG